MSMAMITTILHGFICFLILPSLLFTASLIICGDSRAQQKIPIRKTGSSKERTMSDSSQIKNMKVKRSLTRTKSAESTENDKSHKSLKLSRSKSKAKRAKKSLKRHKSVPITKSMDRISSEMKRSSRFQRFPKHVDRSILRDIDEKIQEAMKMEPKSLNWNTSGGVQRVYLTNPSNERRAIKVKCSDNHVYRVSHVFGIVEPGQILTIDVVRHNGGAKTDKMIFLWTKAERTDKNASMLFNKLSVYPALVLPLTVNNPTE
ncbi:Sperm-specific class P protein [Dirofilaria immitis]